MFDIKEDIITLTNLSRKTLENIDQINSLTISHALYEKLSSNENTLECNLGFATLIIRVEEDRIMYKFIPSDELESNLLAAHGGVDPLLKSCVMKLKKKFDDTYRSLI